MSKVYNKKIITSLVILSLSVFGVAVANTFTVNDTFDTTNNSANNTSQEWEIVKALGGYERMELLDYSINHH